MEIKSLLRQLDLGNSVAEFDEALDRYFVETEAFRALTLDRADIIAGEKGTGKTALYRVFKERYTTIQQLKQVEVVTGFNPAGNPVFQRLAQVSALAEGQYVTVWKTYLLSLVGNWLLELYGSEATAKMRRLDSLLVQIGLRSSDDSAQTIFSKLVNVFTRLLHPKSAEYRIYPFGGRHSRRHTQARVRSGGSEFRPARCDTARKGPQRIKCDP